MYNELSDTLKAKLYDYAYTPFMSSFIISWIVINHKYLLIYFSKISDPEKKLKLLNIYGNNQIDTVSIYDPILPFFQFLQIGSHYFWYPLGFALFYVFIYPFIANFFYSWTRKMNNDKKKIKLKRDNQEPIDKEEQKALLFENHTLRQKIEDLKVDLSTQESKYDERVQQEISHLNQTLELEKQQAEIQINKFDNLVKEHTITTKNLQTKNDELNNLQIEFKQKIKRITSLEAMLEEYAQKLSTHGISISADATAQKYGFTEFEVKLLRHLNHTNFSSTTKDDFIQRHLMNGLKLQIIKANDYFTKLVQKGIIIHSEMTNSVKLSTNSKKFILEAF